MVPVVVVSPMVRLLPAAPPLKVTDPLAVSTVEVPRETVPLPACRVMFPAVVLQVLAALPVMVSAVAAADCNNGVCTAVAKLPVPFTSRVNCGLLWLMPTLPVDAATCKTSVNASAAVAAVAATELIGTPMSAQSWDGAIVQPSCVEPLAPAT